MADATKIYSGPAQVSLYDSTNNELYIGYHEEVEVKEKILIHKLIDGNELQYGATTQVEIVLLQSDPGLLADIVARRTTKQSIYIVAMEHLFQIDNVYVSVARKKNYKAGEFNQLMLTAQTEAEDDVSDIINLLGEDGDCDSGTGGVADGWTDGGVASKSVGASGQTIEFDGHSQTFYYDVICPIDQTITISVQADVTEVAASSTSIMFGFKTKDNAGSVVDNKTERFQFTASQNRQLTKTVTFTPGADVAKISVYFEDFAAAAAEVRFKEVQLEFGSVTTYGTD